MQTLLRLIWVYEMHSAKSFGQYYLSGLTFGVMVKYALNG